MEFANVARRHHSQGRSGDRRTSWMRHLQYIVVMQDSWCRLNFLWQMRSSAKHIIFAKECTILRQDNLVDGRGHVVGRHGRIIVYRILNQDTATSALSSTLQWDLAGIFRTTSIFSRYIEREKKKGKNPNKTWKGQGAHISSYFPLYMLLLADLLRLFRIPAKPYRRIHTSAPASESAQLLPLNGSQIPSL